MKLSVGLRALHAAAECRGRRELLVEPFGGLDVIRIEVGGLLRKGGFDRDFCISAQVAFSILGPPELSSFAKSTFRGSD